MNLIEAIARHLEFLGFGTMPTPTCGGKIHWGLMPDQPDTAICVYSTDSGQCGSQHHPARIQILVRATSTREAYELSQHIANALDGFSGYLHGDGAWAVFDSVNTSVGIGADELRREMYVSNFYVRYCGQ